MANILDYLDWRGDLSFEQDPFNEVDSLILSQLVYTNFEFIVPTVWSNASITLKEAAVAYFNRYSEQEQQQFTYLIRISIPLLRKLADSKRFAEVKLSKFENIVDLDRTKQFAAMHVELSDGTIYIAYRGTDNTIVGWKENFNMSIASAVPAQFEAARYLEDTTEDIVEAEEHKAVTFRVGGHSKGGNLAVFASVRCKESIKSRIIEVYNHDGPGFNTAFITSDEYQQMRSKIKTIVPQSSVVGMLLEHEESYTVVQSNMPLLMQHEPFSWEVMGNGFARRDQLEKKSELLDVTIKSWLNQMDHHERKQFIGALFYVFEEGGIKTFDDLTSAKWSKVRGLIKVLNQSQEKKAILIKTLKLLFSEGKKVLFAPSIKQ